MHLQLSIRTHPGFYVNLKCYAHPRSFFFFFLLLQKVFQTHKDMIIKKTVAQLPLPAVLPLLEKVSRVFACDVQTFYFYIKINIVGSTIFCFFFFSYILDHRKAPRTPFYVSKAFSFHSPQALLILVFIVKAFDIKHQARSDTNTTVVSHRAVLMTRWLKAVLMHHTSYLASVSVGICLNCSVPRCFSLKS